MIFRGSNGDVVKAFRSGQCECGRNYTGTLYFKENILYSYGPHYPLALRYKRPDGRHFYLLNSEQYSMTTSHHNSTVCWALCPHLEADFQALRNIGIDPLKLNLIDCDMVAPPGSQRSFTAALFSYSKGRVMLLRLPGVQYTGIYLLASHLDSVEEAAQCVFPSLPVKEARAIGAT